MNKIKSFKSHALVRHCLLVMVGMLCALPSWAFEVVVNGVKYEVNKQERKAVVVGLADRKSSTMEIQEKVRGYIVSEIKSYAFRDCSLESITIPASAFNIGDHASFENIISNTCNRRGNVYGGERTATVESIISNTVMIILTIVRICHLYGFESIAIHECMISNVKCRSWNRYRF